jgi:curli biogenesis system outer membrane secretion channel CsgG
MKTGFVSVILASILIFSGCVTTQGPTVVKEREKGAVVTSSKGVVERVRCETASSPKISIGKVSCKAAACRSSGPKPGGLLALLQLAGVPNFEGIGDGLQDMFTGALQDTGCFRVFDREAMEALQRELAMSGKQSSLESADYLVMGAVTSINFESKRRSFGGGYIPLLGAISSTKQKATLGMDVRVVKVETGEVVFSKTYSAESGKTSYGIAGFGAGGGVGFGGSVSGLSGTAMEEVARDIVVRATYDIVKALMPANVVKTEYINVKK